MREMVALRFRNRIVNLFFRRHNIIPLFDCVKNDGKIMGNNQSDRQDKVLGGKICCWALNEKSN